MNTLEVNFKFTAHRLHSSKEPSGNKITKNQTEERVAYLAGIKHKLVVSSGNGTEFLVTSLV